MPGPPAEEGAIFKLRSVVTAIVRVEKVDDHMVNI